MMNVEDLLVRNKNGDVIEGYLGDDEQAKILFLLREPNTSADQNNEASIFWFYQILRDKINFDEIINKKDCAVAKRAGTKYINVLGKLSQLVLKEGKEKEELLQQCAYINLYPFGGGSKQSSAFISTKKTLKKFKYDCFVTKSEKITDKSPYEDIIKNRLNILESIGCEHIITTCDIFNALKSSGLLTDFEKKSGFKYKNDKTFNKAKIFGIETYEFYHPCASINTDNIVLI